MSPYYRGVAEARRCRLRIDGRSENGLNAFHESTETTTGPGIRDPFHPRA